MKNQTIKNDPINRGQNEQKELEMKLRLIWLGVSPTEGTPCSLTSSFLLRN